MALNTDTKALLIMALVALVVLVGTAFLSFSHIIWNMN